MVSEDWNCESCGNNKFIVRRFAGEITLICSRCAFKCELDVILGDAEK